MAGRKGCGGGELAGIGCLVVVQGQIRSRCPIATTPSTDNVVALVETAFYVHRPSSGTGAAGGSVVLVQGIVVITLVVTVLSVSLNGAAGGGGGGGGRLRH